MSYAPSPVTNQYNSALSRQNTATDRFVTPVVASVPCTSNLGPTAWQIADVAAGRLDLFWQFGVDPANLLGPALVAREAGASVRTCAGAPWTPDADSFLVGPSGLVSLAVRALAPA